jgi:hypothetical protein
MTLSAAAELSSKRTWSDRLISMIVVRIALHRTVRPSPSPHLRLRSAPKLTLYPGANSRAAAGTGPPADAPELAREALADAALALGATLLRLAEAMRPTAAGR